MKYPWWDKYFELRSRDYPSLKHRDVFAMLDKCLWFVEEHAAQAERNGWRPVHIMRPVSGLAWRWRNVFDPFVTTLPDWMMASHGLHHFVYVPNKDGSVSMLTGVMRQRALMDFGQPEERTL